MTKSPAHLKGLNPEQEEAITTTEGPLLILAGAGSGKTRVLTRRVAHLIFNQVEAKHILAVTFTNKAASEMKARITELVGQDADDVWVSTFHSTCGRILRADIEALGWTRRFSIYDDDDQRRFVKQIMSDLDIDLEQLPVSSVLKQIDHYKNQLLNPADVLRQKRSHENATLLQIWRAYTEGMKIADALDFNDLLCLTIALFEQFPETLERWRERFKYIMVDEYQDTNPVQFRLLRLLAPDPDSNLAVVGDDDQSIYGFRGADVRIILNFKRDYSSAKEIRLEQNYRSSQNILRLANAVVEKNTGRFDKRLWTAAKDGQVVQVRVYPTPEEEAQRVALHIALLNSSEGIAFGDIAIIYRTNATAIRFERELKKRHIPYRIVGGRSFYETREVRDILAFLRLIVNPGDDAALMRIINVPSRGIGPKTLASLRKTAEDRGIPLFQAARALSSGKGRATEAIRQFCQLIDRLAGAARTESPGQLVKHLLSETGYLSMLKKEKDNTDKRIAHLQLLQNDALGFRPPEENESAVDQLRAWLDQVVLSGKTDELPEGGEVTLMTVHCSKGLEYPVVYVVHMMQGIFPHAKSGDRGLAEERRLAYVAFTRAEDRLIITRSAVLPVHPYQKKKGAHAKDEANCAAPSVFLYGLPDKGISGDLPDESDPANNPIPPSKTLSESDRLFLKSSALYHTELRPDSPYRLFQAPDLHRLHERALVHHATHGFGTIRCFRPARDRRYSVVEFDATGLIFRVLTTSELALVHCSESLR